MIRILALTSVLILITPAATAQPWNHLVSKDYSVQRLGCDAIVTSCGEDRACAELKLDQVEKLASEEGDRQLENIARIVHFWFLLTTEKFSEVHEAKAIDMAEKEKGYLKADALQVLADYYWRKKAYTTALEHYIHAYDIYDEYDIDDFPSKAAYSHDYAGRYYHFGDYATAKKYYVKLCREIPTERLPNSLSTLNTLALCYDHLRNLDSAAFYYNKAMDVAQTRGDSTWIGILKGNIADIHYKRKEYDAAKRLLEESLRLNLKNHVMQNAVYNLAMLGDLHLIEGEQEKALELQLKAYDIILEKKKWGGYAVVMRVYPSIARAYAANGEPGRAYAFMDSAMAAKDSVAAERSLLFIAGAQHKTEAQKHMAELQEQDAKLKQQTLVRNTFVVGFVLVMFFSVIALRQKRRIAREKKRSDELLLNILPAETAEELKRKGSAEARGYDLVTVMFTDFKDFTQASERMHARDLVKEINHCYSEFDKIVDRHNIEKIKTIGDSYMCAGGLPVANKTNAEDVLLAAIEIQQFMKGERDHREAHGLPFFQIRIGIHTGSVVAGIVGIRKFAYDIWGDTVNIASRMQSSGEADRINISGSTYELVKERFKCTYRGKVQAKNKGEIDMYFVDTD